MNTSQRNKRIRGIVKSKITVQKKIRVLSEDLYKVKGDIMSLKMQEGFIAQKIIDLIAELE